MERVLIGEILMKRKRITQGQRSRGAGGGGKIHRAGLLGNTGIEMHVRLLRQ